MNSRADGRRRVFMQWLARGAVAATAAPALVACGGGGGDTPPPAGGPQEPGGTVPDKTRFAAIEGVEEFSLQLMEAEAPPQQFAAAMAAYMGTQPVYRETGFTAEGASAWGVFQDGRVHVVVSNFVPKATMPVPAAAPARVRALAAEVPAVRDARLFHTFGRNFDGQGVVDDLSGWLADAGYKVRAGQEGDGRLSALRAVQGDGFFYINTHGGTGRDAADPVAGAVTFSIQSSTLVDPVLEKMPEMIADIQDHRLTYFTAPNGNSVKKGDKWVEVSDTRYGITSRFVKAHWKFAPHSVVFINACTSGLATLSDGTVHARPFHDACFDAGAGVFMGWTRDVSGEGAYRTARYFTDRLLGANAFQPEPQKQRAFPVDEVISDMARKDLLTDPHVGATFVPLRRGGAAPMLVPGIAQLIVDEVADQLVLLGDFGSRLAANPCKVVVGGVEAQVVSWSEQKLVCKLPVSGAGSCGEVRVHVGEHRSNARWITRWDLQVDYRYEDDDRPGLQITGTADLHYRADIGKTRKRPGDEVEKPVRYAMASRESLLPLKAGGSYTAGEDCTYTWRGAGNYPAIQKPGDSRVLFADLKIDTDTRRGAIGMGLGATVRDFTQAGCGSQPATFAVSFGLLDDDDVSFGRYNAATGELVMVPLPSLRLAFGADFTLAAGTHDKEAVHLKWAAATPQFLPTPDDLV